MQQTVTHVNTLFRLTAEVGRLMGGFAHLMQGQQMGPGFAPVRPPAPPIPTMRMMSPAGRGAYANSLGIRTTTPSSIGRGHGSARKHAPDMSTTPHMPTTPGTPMVRNPNTPPPPVALTVTPKTNKDTDDNDDTESMSTQSGHTEDETKC